jgi:hypothetical protein
MEFGMNLRWCKVHIFQRNDTDTDNGREASRNWRKDMENAVELEIQILRFKIWSINQKIADLT